MEHPRSLCTEGGKGREAFRVTMRALLLRIEVAGVTPKDMKVWGCPVWVLTVLNISFSYFIIHFVFNCELRKWEEDSKNSEFFFPQHRIYLIKWMLHLENIPWNCHRTHLIFFFVCLFLKQHLEQCLPKSLMATILKFLPHHFQTQFTLLRMIKRRW